MKGISQTGRACERVNFDMVKNLLEGFVSGSRDSVIQTLQQNITRSKGTFGLNVQFRKKLRVVFDERTTLLFGSGSPLFLQRYNLPTVKFCVLFYMSVTCKTVLGVGLHALTNFVFVSV